MNKQLPSSQLDTGGHTHFCSRKESKTLGGDTLTVGEALHDHAKQQLQEARAGLRLEGLFHNCQLKVSVAALAHEYQQTAHELQALL